MPRIVVERLGHANVFAESFDDEVGLQREVFGAKVFRTWENAEVGSRNALALIGLTCVETFGSIDPDGPIGRWIAAHGSAWHSIEWTVPSLPEAVEAARAHGIRITDESPDYAFTHPKDLHGLALELTEHHFEGDDRDTPGFTPAFWADEHPLGVVGGLTVKVASSGPEKAAADLVALTGEPAYAVERSHLNSVGHGVRFADHAVEFTGSATGVDTDLVGGFVRDHGERIFCVSFTVRDILAARSHLVASGVRFEQYGRRSLMLRPTHGARIELTTLS
ncbi:MAG TPA: hypothetical protein VHC18_13955 [Amycolatopsis sp.]|nr:hypothetical protein [Amycolatopsis sp.]